jgi:hypothetical protein
MPSHSRIIVQRITRGTPLIDFAIGPRVTLW